MLICATFLCSACPSEDEGPANTDEDRPYEVALQTGEEAGTFLSVWGPSSDDVWAVGGQVPAIGEAGTGTMFHHDGSGWTPVELPPDTPLLNWVHGRDGEIWTVGNAGSALRYNGSGWDSIPTPITVPLWGVFVFGPDDVWAVGGDAFTDGSAALTHYNGSAWEDVPLPPLDRDTAALFKVWGVSGDDVWAVGDNGVILRFDGSEWAQVASGTARDLISLWGTGPDEIVAVGGRDVGAVARWDGAQWTTTDIGVLPGLNGVWVNEAGRAVVVGGMGSAAWLEAGSDEPNMLSSSAGFNVLHAVFGFDDGTRVSVGGTLDRSPPYSGIIIESR